jgi:hypothetical protein
MLCLYQGYFIWRNKLLCCVFIVFYCAEFLFTSVCVLKLLFEPAVAEGPLFCGVALSAYKFLPAYLGCFKLFSFSNFKLSIKGNFFVHFKAFYANCT